MKYDHFFWLHIKKSAGITIRSLLQPYYVEVDRSKKPECFIQAEPEEYNDILNNYRVLLGEYQFKRCHFAKEFLYPDRWDKLFSFAFSRDPIDRCISMFYALYWQDNSFTNTLKSTVKRYLKSGKFHYNTSYAFDMFLHYLEESRSSASLYSPLGIQFSTHTASMWDDVTDQEGNILLKKIYRLEQLQDGINQAFELCGIEKRIENNTQNLNVNKNRTLYIPIKSQIIKIKNIYQHDFELYEKAGV